MKICRIYAGRSGEENVLIEFALPDGSNAYYTIVDYDEEGKPKTGECIPISIRKDQRVLITMHWTE